MIEQTKANVEEVSTVHETIVEAEVTGLIQGQQIEHVATVLPSVKRYSVHPMGKLARMLTARIT